MADPRFYDNRGPFRVGELCALAQLESDDADASAAVHDVASLDTAGPFHLTFCDKPPATSGIVSNAGWCIVGRRPAGFSSGSPRYLLSKAVTRSFAEVARQFYPEHEFGWSAQVGQVHESAKIGSGVKICPGVIIGPNAEIGDGVCLGPGCVIGRGVAIGRSTEIGAHTVIDFAYVGDEVIIQPGVVIGASGFGFASGPEGRRKIPQLGRVIVQDRVEIGANSTIDRGALGDTMIGEGSKIDNLVQIGHNTRMGRHCVIAGQVGNFGKRSSGRLRCDWRNGSDRRPRQSWRPGAACGFHGSCT